MILKPQFSFRPRDSLGQRALLPHCLWYKGLQNNEQTFSDYKMSLIAMMLSHVVNTAVQLYWGQQMFAKMSLP